MFAWLYVVSKIYDDLSIFLSTIWPFGVIITLG
jgi:hypothetical protein